MLIISLVMWSVHHTEVDAVEMIRFKTNALTATCLLKYFLIYCQSCFDRK